MRAIKAIDYSPWTFVTSVLESKLNWTTMFEWQKHNQGSKEVPDYLELLEFLDLRARATENTNGEPERKHSFNPPSKNTARPSYMAYTDETCVACKKAIHSLYSCKSFKALLRERKMGMVKDSRLCVVCLGSGHFVEEGPSSSLLYIDSKSENHKAAKASPRSGESTDVVMANVLQTVHYKQVLLITCKVRILGPDGSTT